MKRFFCLLFVLVFLPVVSLSEYPLSENEQRYVGSWSMYADNGKGTIYVFTMVFLDNMKVVQSSLVFQNGILTKNNKASGEWCGFTDNTIIFTLAGTDMTAMIKDDGHMYVYFFKDLSMCGAYSKCEDTTSLLGW